MEYVYWLLSNLEKSQCSERQQWELEEPTGCIGPIGEGSRAPRKCIKVHPLMQSTIQHKLLWGSRAVLLLQE